MPQSSAAIRAELADGRQRPSRLLPFSTLHPLSKTKELMQSSVLTGQQSTISDNSSSSNGGFASDISPSSIVSPIGHTLKHSAEYSREHDLNRTMHSESFYLLGIEEAKSNRKVGAGKPHTPSAAAIDIRIFYPNGTALQFSVENGAEASTEDLLQLMAEHLDIDDFAVAEEALAIWIVSPLLEIQLKSHHIPFEIYQKWPAFLRRFTTAEEDDIVLDEPLLVLRRNVLMTLEREVQFVEKYEQLTLVLYLHARDEYLSGRYPVDIETALRLVGLQLAIEFGPYTGRQEDALNLIYESLHEIAPPPHIKAIRSFHLFGLRLMECKKGLENRVLDEFRTASELFHNNFERRKQFLTILRQSPFYGAAFYSGTIDKSRLADIGNSGGGGEDASDGASLNSGRSRGRGGGARGSGLSPAQRKKRAIISPANWLGRLRHLLHYRNGHQQPNGWALNGRTAARREILIAINHGFITLIDPKEQKVLEVLQDNSPDGNLSLNEKISLFCTE